jgi:replicative DNA helicase
VTPETIALQRGLPAAVEAEKAILTQVLMANRIPAEAEHLRASDFTADDRRTVWRAMQALSAMGRPVSEITLVEVLERRGELAKLGGFTYVASLVDTAFALSAGTIRETLLTASARGRLKVGTSPGDRRDGF